MADTTDYDDFTDEERPLELTYRGKVYTLAPLDARAGMKVQRMFAATARAQDGMTLTETDKRVLAEDDETTWADALGDTYDELLDDGASFIGLRLAANTAILWTVQDRETALDFWEAEGKAPAPVPANREQRRAKTTRTGAASTTKRPGSGTGTSTRPKQSGSAAKDAG